VSHGIGADSEVGCLRTVLVHRPGPELKRITPRTRNLLRFDHLPWVSRAQQEHDIMTEVLRDRGTEVVYLSELLADVLEYTAAREEAITALLASGELGDELPRVLRRQLDAASPRELASALIAGLTSDELNSGRGLVYELLDPPDFVIEPLPNLVFSKDASTWIGDHVLLAGLPWPRRRESDLLAVIYQHHPRFAGRARAFRAGRGRLDGGDVLLLGQGVVAVGVGSRSTPASTELLAKHLLDAGAVHSVLAVPMSQRDDGPLGTVCTVLDSGVVLMAPARAFTLTALTITSRFGELTVSRRRPFLEAAALAVGVERLTVIHTGIDSMPGRPGQWDDGGNALAIGGRVIVCDERNVETNARIADAGFEVITVPSGELGGVAGGPRALCVPLHRDPAAMARQAQRHPPVSGEHPGIEGRDLIAARGQLAHLG
jgi:arginine deiminase